ncbi:head-tail connector protein [Brevundimonas bullata]|uniref:head-tail connector protein n=1 Tax=Brevundimonas bullata TaxID=13160 RepID=UPI000E0B4A01|nr:head-tail connector protein [Brevundimonas bullata]WQE36727.1 head-tail connector protein [Brevundimonas bullata]
MSTIISLASAKQHLGILDGHQDTLVQDLLDAAVDACSRYIGTEDQPDPLPPIFVQAVKMTLAALFEGREGATVPEEAQTLLSDLRPWVFG